MHQPTLGELAYLAYGTTTDFKNYQGLPMPKWEDLTEKIREAWENAAASVNDGWFGHFDERQQKQIRFARLYAQDFAHGADGHNNMLIIAKMSELLGGLTDK
jgi:hypothetical protein